MDARIQGLIEHLYVTNENEDISPILQRLSTIIEDARHRLPRSNQRRVFSQQDVALITYGDSLQGIPDQTPLATLKTFLDYYLADTVNIVHILPFHPFSSDDGFSVMDYEQVDRALGTWDNIHQIAAEYDLMADFVLNHMSAQSEWFKRFLAGDSNFATLFMTAAPDTDISQVMRPRTSPLLTPFERENDDNVHVWTTFSADQVDFNYLSPETMLRMIKLLLDYVQHGAQIIRLDAVAYLWKEIGTSSIHLPQTHAFVQLMRAVLDDVAPHVTLITETNVPHRENISYFGDGQNEAQMVYNFTLPPLLLYAMLSEDATVLNDWACELHPPSPHTTYFNFTASHDGIGMRPLEGIIAPDEIAGLIDQMQHKGGRVSYRKHSDGTESPYEINITYLDAVTNPALDEDLQIQQFLVSQAIMLVLNGVPALYIHSLVGSRNDYAGVERQGHNRAINRTKLDATRLFDELNNNSSFRGKLFAAYRHMLQVRRRLPHFSPQVAHEVLDVQPPAVFALKKALDDHNYLIALHNLSGTAQQLKLASQHQATFAEALQGDTVTGAEIELSPYAVQWLVSQP